jgi:hypothetical protein
MKLGLVAVVQILESYASIKYYTLGNQFFLLFLHAPLALDRI